MSTARDVALEVLGRVEQDRAYAAAALSSALAGVADPREAAFATELVMGVLRRRPLLDSLLHSASDRGLKKIHPKLRRILRIGAYQLIFLERIPNRAVVSEAVEQTRRSRLSRFSGLANAVLRRIAEQDPKSLIPAADHTSGSIGEMAVRVGLPPWLIRRIVGAYGRERAMAIASSYNQPSKRTLRVNTNRIARTKLLDTFGAHATPGVFSPWAVHVANPKVALDAIERGTAVYQDEGAQLIAMALDPKPKERILDACAGRGGKTSALAMMVNGDAEIVASDRGANKLERLVFELDRQGFAVETVAVDLTDPVPDSPLGEPFQKILLDAPCSGTGTMGRRPEIRWRLNRTAITSLVQVQSKLLDSAASLLAPGGHLVYAVCSILPEEGTIQIASFMDRHPDFAFSPAPPPEWPESIPWNHGVVFIDPSVCQTDGYQIASVVKK